MTPSLGLALDFTLVLGIHANSGPTLLRHSFQTNWGKTEVFVHHQAAHELARERIWVHRPGWALALSLTHIVPFGLRLEATQVCRYADLAQHHRQQVAAWGELKHVRTHCQAPYWLVQSLAKRHRLSYAVTITDPVRSRLATSWSVLADQRLQAVPHSPELTWRGRTVRLIAARLSTDEDSPVWLAQLQLADLREFAAMAIGDTLQLALAQEIFVLVVDGKSLSRESQTVVRYEVSAVSPLALLEAPYAATRGVVYAEATPAIVAVTDLIGPVQWQLPHWRIPTGHLQFDGVTPLQAARTIVEAIGGILESQPNGSVVCRKRHPVAVPEYPRAAVAHSLLDSEVIATRARLAPSRGYNRVTLANETGGDEARHDRLEFLVDDESPHQGTLRAYLDPLRPVTLAHSGHPATIITPMGEVVRSETEVVEFIEGTAHTRYPVQQIVSFNWQHANLGALNFDDTTLTASTAGYSLLALTYLTTSRNWRVSLVADEDVQFYLIDA